ncbi:MAG TPA: TolC family protein [bacterium]|nr:TolC family protein [bacterium]
MRLTKLIGIILFVTLTACVHEAMGESVISSGDVLTLDEAINIAMANNKEIAEARQGVSVSMHKVREAKSAGGVSFGLQGQISRTEETSEMTSASPTPAYYDTTMPFDYMGNNPSYTPPANPLDMSHTITTLTGPVKTSSITIGDKESKNVVFSLKKPLYTFGKISRGISIAKNGYRSEELNLLRVRQKVILDVQTAYYYCLLAEEGVRVSEEALKQAQSHLDAATARFNAGAVPEFDVIRARVDVASAQEQLTTARSGLSLAKKALNNVLGLPLNTGFKYVLPDKMEMNFTLSVDKCKEIALNNRIDLQRLRMTTQQIELGADAQRMRPVVAFTANYGIVAEGSLFAKDDTWTAAVAVDVPLFDSGASHSKVAGSKATADKLRITESRLVDGINLEVEAAFDSMKEAQARVETSATIVEQAKEAVRMAEQGYENGVTPHINVIDAQTALTGALMNHAKALYDLETAMAKLAYAMGLDSIQQSYEK